MASGATKIIDGMGRDGRVTFLQKQVPPGNPYCPSLRVAGQTVFPGGNSAEIDAYIGNHFGMASRF